MGLKLPRDKEMTEMQDQWLQLALRLMRNLPLWLLVPLSVAWAAYTAYSIWIWPNEWRPERYAGRHYVHPDRNHVTVSEVLSRSINPLTVRQQMFMLAWRNA